jgi:hypothetical protein
MENDVGVNNFQLHLGASTSASSILPLTSEQMSPLLTNQRVASQDIQQVSKFHSKHTFLDLILMHRHRKHFFHCQSIIAVIDFITTTFKVSHMIHSDLLSV